MKAIYNDNSILINLNELVTIRAKILTQYEDYSNAISTGEYLDENDVDRIAVKLRETLTWDTLYSMVDSAIFDYMGLKDPNKPNYGEIQPEPGREKMLNEMEKNRKQFEMVDLVSPAWTIQVPRRIK
tara:strand:- start:137 stop:517 length:381 start_codon:yes stop_codon:yes gene_type:complete